MNINTIARKVGMTPRQVNEVTRDLGIERTYLPQLQRWEIADRQDAEMLLDHLMELSQL